MLKRLLIWLQLGFNEITYWLVGDTPEAHHAKAAYLWEGLGRYRRSISHCKRYLAVEEDSGIRAMLGYCYSCLGQWEKAIEEYRALPNPTSDPRIGLGLAEAELNVGNIEEARYILATVSVITENSPDGLSAAVDYMKERLDEASRVAPDA